MPLESDATHKLPALHAKPPPAVAVEALLAVAEVTLTAGDVPRGILRAFYEGVVGLTPAARSEDDGAVCFSYQRRKITLVRGRAEPGRVGFLVKSFPETLSRLRDRGIAFEELHIDGGLTRVAITRDPAGNWVHLVETRLL